MIKWLRGKRSCHGKHCIHAFRYAHLDHVGMFCILLPVPSGIGEFVGDCLVCWFFSAQDPHEEQLDEKGVDGKEVCSSVFLGTSYGIAGT